MKIYQVWEHWTKYADAYAFDQRPESGSVTLDAFVNKERAEEFKKEREEEERKSKWCGGYSTYSVEETEVKE
jgi:hypothetical protein